MANTNAIVKRSDAFGTYVQLRVGATETSEFVNGGVIFNGKQVQVLFTLGSFCQVRVQSDAETLVGFVKKEHLVFESGGEERGKRRSGDSRVRAALGGGREEPDFAISARGSTDNAATAPTEGGCPHGYRWHKVLADSADQEFISRCVRSAAAGDAREGRVSCPMRKQTVLRDL